MDKEIPTLLEIIEMGERVKQGGELTEEEIQKVRNLLELLVPILTEFKEAFTKALNKFMQEITKAIDKQEQQAKRLVQGQVYVDGSMMGNVKPIINDASLNQAVLAQQQAINQRMQS